MCKRILILLSVILLLGCASALADTTVSFDSIGATSSFPEDMTYLNASGLAAQSNWLAATGNDADTMLADWNTRGVLAQFWTADNDVCIEVSALQTEESLRIYDVDQQTTAVRAAFRKNQSGGDENKAAGYAIQNAEWKNYKNAGRFLMMQYKRVVNGITTYGYLRRTVKNGYLITVDYQVFNRSLNKSKDLTRLNTVMSAWSFASVNSIPTASASYLTFTTNPPAETNTGVFSVEGKCTPGMEVVGTLMRMADPEPVHVSAVANKSGDFKLDVTLPTEGWWLMTVTAGNDNEEGLEKIFDLTNFDKSMLPVNFDSSVPEVLTSDETIISGQTIKNVSIQCIVSTPTSTYDKTVKTNNKGTFSFKIPTANAADYSMTIIFQKKGYNTRRFTFASVRQLTEEDYRNQIRASVVKPAYTTLKSKLDGYMGKNMVYRISVTEIQQSGDQWLVFACFADKTTGKPLTKQKIVIVCTEEPPLSVGSVVRFYGTLNGTYLIQSEESNENLPCFDYLFTESI